MELKLPEGMNLAVLIGIIGNLVALIWYVSGAHSRLREHGERLTKVEARVDLQDDRLDTVITEVKEALAGIKATLAMLVGGKP